MFVVCACNHFHLGHASCTSVARGPSRLDRCNMSLSSIEWSNDKILEFINDYRNYPELWDSRTADYKNNQIKQDRMGLLSVKYSVSVEELKKKIKSLRSGFPRERRRREDHKSGSAPLKQKKWFAFESLEFLRDVDTPRRATCTINIDHEELNQFCELDDGIEQVSDNADSSFVVPTVHGPNSPNSHTLCADNSLPQRKSRKRKVDYEAREEEVYEILKNAVNSRDECSVYGDYIASEMRSVDPQCRPKVKQLIQQIFLDAAMGKYTPKQAASSQTEDDFLYASDVINSFE